MKKIPIKAARSPHRPLRFQTTGDVRPCFQAGWPSAISSVLMLILLVLFASPPCVAADAFRITSVVATNSAVEITFPGRSDSYYFLHSSSLLTQTSPPVAALLGNDETLTFSSAVGAGARSFFFRVEQIPLASTNDYLGDGIPDGWKLQHGLDPFDPTAASQVPLGDTRPWLQIYLADSRASQLPVAYFAQTSTNVVAGSSNFTVQVSFTKLYTGQLSYSVIGGTAIPSSNGAVGDYIPPSGTVSVSNAATAPITITLVSHPAVEVDRTILLALSVPQTNQTYTITNNTSVSSIRIVQSTGGVFVGSLGFVDGIFMAPQAVKMAIRPSASGKGSVAFFDTTGNPLLGDTFSVPVIATNGGFQLSESRYSGQVTNTPFGRTLNLNLRFGPNQTNGASFRTPVDLIIDGLTASGQTYLGAGWLVLTRSE